MMNQLPESIHQIAEEFSSVPRDNKRPIPLCNRFVGIKIQDNDLNQDI